MHTAYGEHVGLLRRILARPQRDTPAAPAGAEWIASGEWRTWDAPLDIVAGESRYLAALQSIAGPPRPGGWLVPVEAALEREPENRHDPAAIVVRIADLIVGYISAELSDDLAEDLDRRGPRVRVRGCPALIRGGWPHKPNLGVMLWINHLELREVFPNVDFDELREEYAAPNWPANADEGEPDIAGSVHTGRGGRRDAVVPCADPRLPPLSGHFTDYVEDVLEWKRRGLLDEAALLLSALIDATEAESRESGLGVVPWYYEQLAIVRRRQHDVAGEIAVLERFAGQVHAPGAGPPKLLERLRRLRAAAEPA